jgi:hypothetical protein
MRCFYFGLLFVAASSCATLYQPLLATLPAVRKPGDVAVASSWQFPYGAQVSVIASPLPHTLAFASGGIHAYNTKRDSSNDYARNRQYEAGIGGYVTVKRTWLSAAVGAGQGRGFRYGRFGSSDILNFGVVVVPGGVSGSSGRPLVPELLGYYDTQFAQVTAWWPGVQHTTREWGSSLRLTQVRFTDLTLNGIAQPLPTRHQLQASLMMQQPLSRTLKWQAATSFDVSPEQVADEKVIPVSGLRLRVGLVFYPRSTRPVASVAP